MAKKLSEAEEAEEIEGISKDISDVKFYDIPTILIFWLLFTVIALQFFTRYVLNNSFTWTEEIGRYLLIILCFLGGIICIRKNSHIYLEFIYYKLPAPVTKAFILFTETLTGAFFLFCSWFAWSLSERINSYMVSVKLPKSIIFYLVTLSCLAMGLVSFIQLIKKIKKSPEEVVKSKLDHIIEEI